jgi:ketosteroid isomerase-like protein
MPSRERVEAFIAKVVSGDHVGAIAEFYHEDASMQEPGKAPRYGREILIEHERQALERLARMVTHPPKVVLVDGDNVVVHWLFDAVGHDGAVRRLEELALQRWSGDRIAEERFFYDTASAWERQTAVG